VNNPAVTWIKFILIAALIAGGVWFAFSIGTIVRMVIISFIVAYLLSPLINSIESRGVERTLATVTVFFVILIVAGCFFFLVLPTIIDEIRAAQQSLTTGQASDRLYRIKDAFEDKLAFIGIRDLDIMGQLSGYFVNLSNEIFRYLLNAFSLATNLIVIPFISFFLAKDIRLIKKQFIRMVPNRFFEFTLNVFHKMDVQLGNYIRGQLLESAIVGGLSIIALWLLNVDYYIVLGTFAGILNIIPYIGPVVGVIPPILVSLYETGDLALAGYIILFFTIVQLIDNGVLKPVVVGGSVDIHPLLILLAVIIGGKFFGILGMILSIPATGFLKVIIQESTSNLRKYRFS